MLRLKSCSGAVNREFRQRIQQIVKRQQREVDEASKRKPPVAYLYVCIPVCLDSCIAV
jgi:hypothetical protein